MSNKPENTTKIVAILVIAVALGTIAYFLLRSNSSSGTIDSEVKQMKPSARAKK